ncbi:MAG TPA: cyclic nucleotide-binding domain-containing protein [Mycobacteriales bacterium]|nr:cyclic nucleotide-binding domain-containing protein [Mycobacteriales bacterium]
MADKEIEDWLKQCHLFRELSGRTLRSLASSARHVSHEAGRPVVEQGQQAVGFHLITHGSAIVEVPGGGERTLKPGDYFGVVSMIDGKPRSATVRAGEGEALQTIAITPWVFQPLLKEQPSIAQALMPALCDLLRSAEQDRATQT